jgi:predicted RNase H-like HicB family nuclease
MSATYTAVVQQSGEWWIGWVEEVPGVNSQGQTREELLDNLREALEETLEMNRADARAEATGTYERSEPLLVKRQDLIMQTLLQASEDNR